MGWSCSSAAGATLDIWTQYCVKETGSQNVFKIRGVHYMFEVSRTEHRDGRITGEILCFPTYNPKGESNSVIPAGRFCISADGTPRRAPSVLKALGKGANHGGSLIF